MKLKRREYRLRLAGQDGGTIEISLPREVIKEEARKVGLPIKQFLKQYRGVAIFGPGLEGVYYKFEKIQLEETLDLETMLAELNEE